MNPCVQWSDRRFEEIRERIVLDFPKDRESKAEPFWKRRKTDRLCRSPGADNVRLYTSRKYCPSKSASYRSDIGEFKFTVDSEGNATIEDFYAAPHHPYVKLPSEVYDASTWHHRRYPVKRVDHVEGGNCLKGLWIPEGIEILGKQFYKSFSLMDVYFPRSLIYFASIFWNAPQFEQEYGNGRVWYPGSREEWESLRDSEPSRFLTDCTSYDSVVRFYDPADGIRIQEMEVTDVRDEEREELIRIREMEAKDPQGMIRICNRAGDVMIPETWEADQRKRRITEVGRNAFANNGSLTGVTIPPSVKRIGQDAFYGCESLKNVVVLPGVDELVIETGAFFNCSSLRRVEFGRDARIEDWAFAAEEEAEIEAAVHAGCSLRKAETAFCKRTVTETVIPVGKST